MGVEELFRRREEGNQNIMGSRMFEDFFEGQLRGEWRPNGSKFVFV